MLGPPDRKLSGAGLKGAAQPLDARNTMMTHDPLNSEAVLDRLLAGAGLQRDAQLAGLLGVTPQAVSQARRKRKIPENWMTRVAMRCGVSLDWLLFGVGAPRIGADESEVKAGSVVPAGPGNSTGPIESANVLNPISPASKAASSVDQASRGGVPPQPSLVLPTQPDMPDIDLLCVPLVSASLSAGTGSLETDGEVLDFFAFRSDWLCRKGNPDRMVLMKVYGDSMEPEIRHGDMALIDQSKQQIYPHTIYAVGVNEEIYIKQVETLPGHRMILRSLNERYNPIEVDLRGDMAESVRIIGKVIWWCREA